MSEEDRNQCHADIIEEIISKKMTLIYWMIGGSLFTFLLIYISIALPLSAQVIKMNEKQSSMEASIKDKVDSSEAYENFLPKGTYHRLQKDEHESDLEAIRNPENADLIYMKNNSREAENLGIASRGAESYKKAYDKMKNGTN